MLRPRFLSDHRQVSADLMPNGCGFVVESYRVIASVAYVVDCYRPCVPPTSHIGFGQGIEQARIIEVALTTQDRFGSSFEWHVSRVQIRGPRRAKDASVVHAFHSTRHGRTDWLGGGCVVIVMNLNVEIRDLWSTRILAVCLPGVSQMQNCVPWCFATRRYQSQDRASVCDDIDVRRISTRICSYIWTMGCWPSFRLPSVRHEFLLDRFLMEP